MSDKSTFIKNNLFVFTNRIISKLITFFLMLFLARELEPNKFGELTLLISLTSIFTSLLDFGTSPIIVRQIASRIFDPEKTLVAIFLTKIITATVFILCFQLLIFLLGYSSFSGNFIYLFAFGFVSESLLLSVVKYLEGKEDMSFSSILIISERVIISMGMILISNFIGLFDSYGISYFISNSLVVLIALSFFTKNFGFFRNFQYKIVKELLKLSAPFIAYNVFSIIYFRLDVFIIAEYYEEALVGTYRAGYQLVDSLYFISLSLSVSLLPFFSRKYRDDNSYLQKAFSFIIKELFFLGSLLSIFIFIYSEQILQVLYEDKYLYGAVSFGILSLTIPLFFLNNVMGNLLISTGKEKIQISSMVISTFLKTLLLIIFVKTNGIIGAAVSCLIAELFSFLIQYFGVRRSGYGFEIKNSDLISAVLILIVVLLGILVENLFFFIGIVTVIYMFHSRKHLKFIIPIIRNN